eukprot:gene25420-33967_t
MTTEISYGYFLDVIDEFANPIDKNSTADDILSNSNSKVSTENKGILTQLLKAVEKANLTQNTSTESLPSMRSSYDSLSASNSTQNMNHLGTVKTVFTAIQSITLPSSDSLCTMQKPSAEETENEIKQLLLLPSFVIAFFSLVDNFMQNHSNTGSATEGKTSDDDAFPKFC